MADQAEKERLELIAQLEEEYGALLDNKEVEFATDWAMPNECDEIVTKEVLQFMEDEAPSFYKKVKEVFRMEKKQDCV